MPEFMLALRAACLKLRKERENSPRYTLPFILDVQNIWSCFFHCWRLPLSFHSFLSAGAVKRTTLVKSTNSDNNNSNSMLPMLDLTLNDLSLLSGWLGWTPSQEFILCEEMCPVLFLCSPFAIKYCSSSKEQLELNFLDTTLLSCHLNEFLMSYLQKITVAPSLKQISSKFSHLHISRMSLWAFLACVTYWQKT